MAAPKIAKVVYIKNNTNHNRNLQLYKPDWKGMLWPGINRLDASVWARLETDSEIAWLLDESKLEVVGKPIAVNVCPLTKLADGPAVAFIRDTTNVQLLADWAKLDWKARGRVARALAVRQKDMELTDAEKESAKDKGATINGVPVSRVPRAIGAAIPVYTPPKPGDPTYDPHNRIVAPVYEDGVVSK